jgi:hypothetical protein
MKLKLIVLSWIVMVSACTWLDFGVEWRSGRFGLVWVDLPDEVKLAYNSGGGLWATIVEPRVFEVGSNQEFIVAKQHPRGDRKVTNYFIVDIHSDSKDEQKYEVIGPLTSNEFQERAAVLPLPAFSKTLESLQ